MVLVNIDNQLGLKSPKLFKISPVLGMKKRNKNHHPREMYWIHLVRGSIKESTKSQHVCIFLFNYQKKHKWIRSGIVKVVLWAPIKIWCFCFSSKNEAIQTTKNSQKEVNHFFPRTTNIKKHLETVLGIPLLLYKEETIHIEKVLGMPLLIHPKERYNTKITNWLHLTKHKEKL